MFLAGTPVYTTMLMGRWPSDAFMRYIRKQVLSLSHGIAAKMLTFEQFYTVPDFVHTSADGNLRPLQTLTAHTQICVEDYTLRFTSVTDQCWADLLIHYYSLVAVHTRV
jgi:hypothetical protein